MAKKVQSTEDDATVVGIDLLEIAHIPGVKFVQGDISKKEDQEKVSEFLDYNKADLVVSDAVPDFIGDRFTDHSRACYLNQSIINFCEIALKPGGNLLMKILQGPAEKELSEFTTKFFSKL